MIVVHISGGLGNQMFQYALGRHLSVKNRCALYLDCSYYEGKGNLSSRKLQLDKFNIRGRILSKDNLMNKVAFHAHRLLSGSVGTVHEKSMRFDSHMLGLPKGTALKGHWQCHRYFDGINGQITSELSINPKYIHPDTTLQQHALSEGSVAVHFRLGDYLSNPEVYAIHGICPPDYYQRAFRHFQKSLRKPKFLFFSDNPEWVRANVEAPEGTLFVTGQDFLDDFYLMSLCNHQIISNSTFSWWAAWLNRRVNKQIIAPKAWFADTTRDSRDIVPETWLKL